MDKLLSGLLRKLVVGERLTLELVGEFLEVLMGVFFEVVEAGLQGGLRDELLVVILNRPPSATCESNTVTNLRELLR